MQIIARRTLRLFWKIIRRRSGRFARGFSKSRKRGGPADVKDQFGTTVDFIGDNRLIFDLGGNKYRLVAHVSYPYGRVLVKFVGAHSEYDRINPETVSWRGK